MEKSLGTMADECGLRDLYRHPYQMLSGVAHSDWWSVEIHCMEPCLNFLHRGHLIPSMSLPSGGNADVARSWLIALYGLIRARLDILDLPEGAVQSAFGWLEGAPGPEDAWRRPDTDENSDDVETSSFASEHQQTRYTQPACLRDLQTGFHWA
jgi:hypothetical protein